MIFYEFELSSGMKISIQVAHVVAVIAQTEDTSKIVLAGGSSWDIKGPKNEVLETIARVIRRAIHNERNSLLSSIVTPS